MPEVYPLERITSDDVTKVFIACWIPRFGTQYDITDREPQFFSVSMKALEKRYGFTQCPTIPVDTQLPIV